MNPSHHDDLDTLLSHTLKRQTLQFDAESWLKKNHKIVDQVHTQGNLHRVKYRRISMYQRKIHIIAAAIILLAIGLTLFVLTGTPEGASIAWSQITNTFGLIDHFHYYEMVSKGNTLTVAEGWYAHQQLHSRSEQPLVNWYDDRTLLKAYDEHQNLVVLSPSNLKVTSTPLSVLSLGLETLTTDSLKGLTPQKIGDFLIYRFPPS